nr:MAG TPA: excisionase [Caudoviricetes sp.]
MEQKTIGMTITEVSRALHVGVEQLREYARTDPTFPCFSVGNKLITTEAAISEWATARAKMRVGMKTESSHVMEIIRRNRRRA